MRLIVIRHGQTEGNAMGVLQGKRIDQPLNAAGIREARLALAKVAETGIAALYSSPLRRARETAHPIASALDLTPALRDELAERDFGDLSGLTWEEAAAKANDPALKEKDKNRMFDYRGFGGESAKEVRLRIRRFLEDSLRAHPRDAIACITHSGIIRLLYDELGVPQPAHVSNASLHTFKLAVIRKLTKKARI